MKSRPQHPSPRSPATSREKAAKLLNPALQAGLAVGNSCLEVLKSNSVKIEDIVDEIDEVAAAVSRGDMSGPEKMAFSQATALNVMFSRLTEIAFLNIQKPVFDSMMRLAFRAQSQCARTLETLATLKNPTVFTQQLNVANQQVVSNCKPAGTSFPTAPVVLPDSSPIVRSANSEIPTPAHEILRNPRQKTRNRPKQQRLD